MTYCEQHGFQATYEAITSDSAEQGDAAQRGYLDWLGDHVDNSWDSHWDLSDLLRLQGYQWSGDGSTVPRWITCWADMSDLIHHHRPWGFLADCEGDLVAGDISIHRPDWITDASWLRVCRLLGWRPYGERFPAAVTEASPRGWQEVMA